MWDQPKVDELWRLRGRHRYGVLHDSGAWSVLVRRNGEWTLDHTQGVRPQHRIGTAEPGWAGHFDALTEACGVGLTWAGYIASLQRSAQSA